MTANNLIRAGALAFLLVQATALATEPLRHDLFARPALSGLAHAVGTDGEAAAGPPPPPQKLLALIVAGKDSMANVDGTIVRVGQEYEGLRLLSVREGEAVFVKKDQVVVLTLHPAGPVTSASGGGR